MWAHIIYEGAIGLPRQTTSLCNLLGLSNDTAFRPISLSRTVPLKSKCAYIDILGDGDISVAGYDQDDHRPSSRSDLHHLRQVSENKFELMRSLNQINQNLYIFITAKGIRSKMNTKYKNRCKTFSHI
jgi:hypothetical protein